MKKKWDAIEIIVVALCGIILGAVLRTPIPLSTMTQPTITTTMSATTTFTQNLAVTPFLVLKVSDLQLTYDPYASYYAQKSYSENITYQGNLIQIWKSNLTGMQPANYGNTAYCEDCATYGVEYLRADTASVKLLVVVTNCVTFYASHAWNYTHSTLLPSPQWIMKYDSHGLLNDPSATEFTPTSDSVIYLYLVTVP
jgi:hypothetical protein